ncbi:MAG: hypothetical protein NZM26_01390 [Patescibacteria group bacterium]|nr:hypothetical protein [Patescibacteria group bacterium]
MKIQTSKAKPKKTDPVKQEISKLCQKISAECKKNKSAINQLKNIVHTSLTGIEVPKSDETKNKGLNFSVLSEMLLLIQKLRNQNYLQKFENFINKDINTKLKEEVIIALINFLLFLDKNSYKQIASVGLSNVSILPIQSILKLRKKLPKDKRFGLGYDLLPIRFPNYEKLNSIITVQQFDNLGPQNAVNVAKAFLKHKNNTIPRNNFVFGFLRYLTIYDARNVDKGIKKLIKELKLGKNHSTYLKRIINYCKAYRIITANSSEELNICNQAFKAVCENPFADAADIGKTLDNKFKNLNIMLFTGAFAGFTVAHYDTINLIQNFNKINKKPSTRSLVVIAPITKPWDIPEKTLGKSPALIGHITPRVQTIMLGIAFTNRKEVSITTKAVPDPQKTISPQERIIKIEENLKKSIQEKKPNIKIKITRCMGIDDVNKILEGARNGKYPYEMLLIGRREKLIEILINISKLQKINNVKIIITPGIEKTSSSQAINKCVNCNNDIYWPIATTPLARKYWSYEAITSRQSNHSPEDDYVPTIEEIYKNLLEGYPTLLQPHCQD